MRAQAKGNTLWKFIAFILGFPGTLLTLLVVTAGGERAYGIFMPQKRQGEILCDWQLGGERRLVRPRMVWTRISTAGLPRAFFYGCGYPPIRGGRRSGLSPYYVPHGIWPWIPRRVVGALRWLEPRRWLALRTRQAAQGVHFKEVDKGRGWSSCPL